MTIRRKLLLWYSGIFFLSSLFLTGVVYLLVAHKMRSEFFHYLRDEFQEGRRIVQQNNGDATQMMQDVEVEVLGRRFFPLSYELYDTHTGEYRFRLAPEWPDRLPAAPSFDDRAKRPVVEKALVGDGPDRIVYFASDWVDADALPGLVFRMGMSYERTHKRLAALREYLLYGLLVGMVVSVTGGRFLAGRSLKPVDEIASSLERIEAGSLSSRLPEPRSNDEIGRIVKSANHMLARLETAFELTKRFSADAAHELRTPLAVLKCRLDVALQDRTLDDSVRVILREALDQTQILSDLVEKLLLMARLDAAKAPPQPENVNLAELLADIGEIFEVAAQQKQMAFATEAGSRCVVSGDRTLLRHLLSNLMDNAIRYTPPRGRVKVTCRREKDSCRVDVSDTGIGMRRQDLERVFERFYRADPSHSTARDGTGLGLSICRSIVELHGGSIDINTRQGEGTCVTVRLPLAPLDA